MTQINELLVSLHCLFWLHHYSAIAHYSATAHVTTYPIPDPALTFQCLFGKWNRNPVFSAYKLRQRTNYPYYIFLVIALFCDSALFYDNALFCDK